MSDRPKKGDKSAPAAEPAVSTGGAGAVIATPPEPNDQPMRVTGAAAVARPAPPEPDPAPIPAVANPELQDPARDQAVLMLMGHLAEVKTAISRLDFKIEGKLGKVVAYLKEHL